VGHNALQGGLQLSKKHKYASKKYPFLLTGTVFMGYDFFSKKILATITQHAQSTDSIL
jgi:hypothetical protein